MFAIFFSSIIQESTIFFRHIAQHILDTARMLYGFRIRKIQSSSGYMGAGNNYLGNIF